MQQQNNKENKETLPNETQNSFLFTKVIRLQIYYFSDGRGK